MSIASELIKNLVPTLVDFYKVEFELPSWSSVNCSFADYW